MKLTKKGRKKILTNFYSNLFETEFTDKDFTDCVILDIDTAKNVAGLLSCVDVWVSDSVKKEINSIVMNIEDQIYHKRNQNG